jgi:hypothetical protein
VSRATHVNTLGLEQPHEMVLAMIEYLADTYGDDRIRTEGGTFAGSSARDIAHGSRAGYQAETRRGLDHCAACTSANTADAFARRVERDARIHARQRVDAIRSRLAS